MKENTKPVTVAVVSTVKRQEKMYIKKGCTVKAHKDNMRTFNAHLISNTDQHVFIQVKSKEDSVVWTAITLAYEVVARNWEHLWYEKRPLSKWKSIFDWLHALDASTQNLQLAMKIATDAATNICKKRRISPLKRAHSHDYTITTCL